MNSSSRESVTFVVPLFNEEENLEELSSRLSSVMGVLGGRRLKSNVLFFLKRMATL